MPKINSNPVHVTIHFDDATYPTKVRATVDEIFTDTVLMETGWTAVSSDPLAAANVVFEKARQWLVEHMDESETTE